MMAISTLLGRFLTRPQVWPITCSGDKTSYSSMGSASCIHTEASCFTPRHRGSLGHSLNKAVSLAQRLEDPVLSWPVRVRFLVRGCWKEVHSAENHLSSARRPYYFKCESPIESAVSPSGRQGPAVLWLFLPSTDESALPR